MEKPTCSGLFKTLTEGALPLLMGVILLSENRLAAVPPYPGLRQFTDGRDFIQWTGDQTKALMKVCSPLFLQYTFC
jgi:hypothetical protein